MKGHHKALFFSRGNSEGNLGASGVKGLDKGIGIIASKDETAILFKLVSHGPQRTLRIPSKAIGLIQDDSLAHAAKAHCAGKLLNLCHRINTSPSFARSIDFEHIGANLIKQGSGHRCLADTRPAMKNKVRDGLCFDHRLKPFFDRRRKDGLINRLWTVLFGPNNRFHNAHNPSKKSDPTGFEPATTPTSGALYPF